MKTTLDSRFLAAGLENGSVEIWQWEIEALITILEGTGNSVNVVAWSNNEEEPLLATGDVADYPGLGCLWRKTYYSNLSGHEASARVTTISWIPST
ncbi:MAG: hypothetical protein R2856_38350 [Caldilineaceae bacterium]